MNPLKYNNKEDYISVTIKPNHTITEFINNGMISLVFKVVDETGFTYACKVIPKDNVVPGWKLEINKIRKLQDITGVIRCYDSGGKPTQIDPLPPNETDPLSPFQTDPLIPA